MKRPLQYFLFLSAFLAFNVFLSSCGGNSGDVIASIEDAKQSPENNLPINLQVNEDSCHSRESGNPECTNGIPAFAGMTDERNDNRTSPWHKFLYSDNYTGEIAVMFKDGMDAAKLLQEIASASPRNDTQVVRRGIPNLTEEQVNEAIERAKRKGVTLNNWNQFFVIKESDPARAETILVELAKSRAVKWVQPHLLPQLAEAGGTSSIVDDQQYLYPNETHGGLNIITGWEAGAYGAGVTMADLEVNWNFNHEDLGIAETDVCYDDGALPSNPNDAKYVNHGTAVVGILSASKNNIGIDGIASKAKMKLFKGSLAVLYDLVLGTLSKCSDGTIFKPGDVIAIELQMKGNLASKCDIGDLPSGTVTGCVPMEAWPEFYDLVADAVKSGYVVIEGAGNGAVDLGSPEAHIEYGPDLSKDSTGAIMVGASLGEDHEKAWYSNCGNRLDVYAWGANVVTTGYGDHPASDPNDANKWYTKQFDGTSAATAIIGGVAAQLQSYVKKVSGNPALYLTPKQMKKLLIDSGVPAVGDDGCSIGIQPDVGKAVQLINEGKIINYDDDKVEGKLVLDPLNDTVVSGIRYDMDGDGRAELISFSKDHKWYIDLSSKCSPDLQVGQTCGDDGYGAWDLIFDTAGSGVCGSAGQGCMLFPVAHDYNSDGRADLALYDSINGKWYIKYTTSSVIASPEGAWQSPASLEWDRVIDYSSDPNWKKYSRPVPGDYNGDRWLDTALQTPDGHWLIDYGGFDGVKIIPETSVIPAKAGIPSVEYLDHFNTFDKDVAYLTTDQLAQAPGWAWLPVATQAPWGIVASSIVAKSPDGILDENNLIQGTPPDFDDIADSIYFPAHVYGDNSNYFVGGKYDGSDIAIKTTEGSWLIFEGMGTNWQGDPITLNLDGVFGDINCRPIPADYDGDGKDDRAVQCGTTWKIAYSSDTTGTFREVELDQALDPLPAYAYPGGIKYQDTVALYDYYKSELGGTKDSTIFTAPPPIGPYFAQCIKFWAPNASYCWDK